MCCNTEPSTLDTIGQISSIITAILSFVFAVYIFIFQYKRQKEKEEKNKENERIYILIYEHNLGKLFAFFENTSNITKQLQNGQLSDEEKGKINDEILNELSDLRLNFTDLLLVINITLYNKIKDLLDELTDGLTESIFNEGINLSHQPKYKDVIENHISSYKTKIINVLFKY